LLCEQLKLGDLLQGAVPHSKLALPLGFTRFQPPAAVAAPELEQVISV
jgi:hypothetical protein